MGFIGFFYSISSEWLFAILLLNIYLSLFTSFLFVSSFLMISIFKELFWESYVWFRREHLILSSFFIMFLFRIISIFFLGYSPTNIELCFFFIMFIIFLEIWGIKRFCLRIRQPLPFNDVYFNNLRSFYSLMNTCYLYFCVIFSFSFLVYGVYHNLSFFWYATLKLLVSV